MKFSFFTIFFKVEVSKEKEREKITDEGSNERPSHKFAKE